MKHLHAERPKMMPDRITLIFSLLFIASLASAWAEERSFTNEERAWWAIQPVVDPQVPSGDGHPIDAFIERKRSAANLIAARAASAREFVRRAYFDLHGLPPTPDQVEAFTVAWQRDQEAAVEGLIDELLASPRYGERWAQHWLDVVRYAESDGYREDAFRPGAHRYRDYVIRALNDDKPYDQFVREQLAADEIAPDDPTVLEATGFLRLGVYEWNQRDAEGQREIMINEITGLTSEVFLGLGLGCARCHDHKFDPLLQRDYFALQSFLSTTVWPIDRKLGTPQQLQAHAELKKKTAGIRAEIDQLLEQRNRKGRDVTVKMFPAEVQAMCHKPAGERTAYEEQIVMLVERQVVREVAKTKPESALAKDKEKLARYKELKAELDGLEVTALKLQSAFISTDAGPEAAATLMQQGKEKISVEPAFLTLLGAPAPRIEPTESSTGRRRALAEWIASTQNPLAARVAVNRMWQHHFSKGLAASPNDFGTLGAPPSHPELLDWLATRFVEGGWKMKPLHRLIMTSATYRQTARREPGERETTTDDANLLLWRYPPSRLSAEQVRDAMLAVSGELDHRVGGASVDGSKPVRSLYVKKKRNTPEPFLHSFDAPAGFDSAPDRQLTTTPTQALLLANNDWPMARARAFANRIKRLDKENPLPHGYRLAWGREPSDAELDLGRKFIAEQSAELKKKLPVEAPVRFPNETGVRPIAQNFSSVSGIDLGSRALWLQPGSRFERLHAQNAAPEGDTFTIEAVAQLDAIQKDASVNTLVSRWNGDHGTAGWAFGVTSEKSGYKPRNFIVQLIGHNPGGDVEYEVVASNLFVPTGKPVLLRATIAPGKIHFALRDLSNQDVKEQTAVIEHNLVSHFQDAGTKLLIGGRDQGKNSHLWDGQLGRLEIGEQTLTFADKSMPVGAQWLKKKPQPVKTDPQFEALADFCHALLSSNEFLYLH